MPPYLGSRPPWFCFLVHPRDLEDVLRSGPGRFLRRYSADDAAVRRKLRTMHPMVTAEIRFGFELVRGELIGLHRFPEELKGAAGVRSVAEAAELALRRGARVIGLGGLTSPATGGGRLLVNRIPAGVVVTNGNAYTASVIRRNVLEAAAWCGTGSESIVGIIGSTGSVGVAASRLLADDGFRLVLAGRTARRTAALLADAIPHARFAGSVAEVAGCDVVVTLTSDPGARLPTGLLAPGSVIVDGAQPAAVSAADRARMRARGVTIVEGGLVAIPDFSCDYDFQHEQGAAVTFACLAETYLFAREGLREHSVGRPEPALAKRLETLAERRRIRPLPLALDAHHDEPPLVAAGRYGHEM